MEASELSHLSNIPFLLNVHLCTHENSNKKKTSFDGICFQTAKLNEGAALIYALNKGFSENKKGQNTDFSALSNAVTRIGQISNQLEQDLKLLTRLIA